LLYLAAIIKSLTMQNATKQTMQTIARIKKRPDFLLAAAAAQKNGFKWVSKTVIVQRAPNHHGQPRFGITVTKKTVKQAPKRNRIKRRLRAAFYDLSDFTHNLATSAPDNSHYDYVLIGRPAALDCTYETLMNDLKWCLKRMHAQTNQNQAEQNAPDQNTLKESASHKEAS